MLIVGELLNTSCLKHGQKIIEQAIIARDAATISDIARRQHTAGADYLDINAGTLGDAEPEALAWLTTVVQQTVPAPICFDSPTPAALSGALRVYRRENGQPMINSISAGTASYAVILPLVRAYQAKVIALAIDDDGISTDPAKRHAVACKLVERLTADDVPLADIYLDPLTFPLGSVPDAARSLLALIAQLRAEFPGLHTIAGFSNISHGLPARRLLNQALVLLALGSGIDAGILDPTDRHLMGLIAATEALFGREESCRRYIDRARAGTFYGI